MQNNAKESIATYITSMMRNEVTTSLQKEQRKRKGKEARGLTKQAYSRRSITNSGILGLKFGTMTWRDPSFTDIRKLE